MTKDSKRLSANSTSCSPGRPAKHSVSPGFEGDSTTPEETLLLRFYELSNCNDPKLLSGKTSPECVRLTGDGRLEPSLVPPVFPTVAIQARATDENVKNGPGGKGFQEDLAYTLESQSNVQAVAHALRGEGFDASEDGTGRGTPLVSDRMTVRRLTPRECERLQGLPDDYTLLPFKVFTRRYGLFNFAERLGKGDPLPLLCFEYVHQDRHPPFGRLVVRTYATKPINPDDCPDAPRYKAIGNSMAVNCVRLLGERVDKNGIDAVR